ncbi:MAG: hypothetical protein PHV05_00540 [Candidatus Riflebacteria bacterium]|nr:hypothetical protein [Candidatus Riflebacteria bacterium]
MKYREKTPGSWRNRCGFVLFFVCTFALLMMIMIVSLSSHKSGAVLQLNRTIEQERIVLFAQAGINEMLAAVKAGVNDKNTSIGSRIFSFWKSNPGSGAKVLYNVDFAPSQLPASNNLVANYIGKHGEISGSVSVVVANKVGGPRPSYTGYVELIGKAKFRDLPSEIRLKERREIKIVDLSDPFIDKYALFVKSFCRNLNNPKKRILIQGITPDDPARYSFIYLGNRSYPACPEFPKGAKSDNSPPVILDLCFKDDNHLLGAFYKPASFQTVSSQYAQASENNLFFAIPPFSFNNIAGSFSKTTDFHNTPELVEIYKSVVNSSSKFASTEGSIGYMIAKDYQKSGGNPAGSDVFRSLVTSLMQNWKYHYGYTDYSCIMGENSKSFIDEHPFSGVVKYFEHFKEQNPQRIVGGKMPLLFGEGRDIPVYVEGPVYLRFFRVGFLDQVTVKFDLHGGNSMNVPFPPVPLHYEDPPETFAGKLCNPLVDQRTRTLMSTAIDSLSINNFFFGAGTITAKSPTAVRGGVEGHDVFPSFDDSFCTVAHIYNTAEEFARDRIKTVDGQKILALDGISLILGSDNKSLDLTAVEKYRGKGRIIVNEGNCFVGNLLPVDQKSDSLAVYLMFGKFIVKSASNPVNIFASLSATTCFSDNSSPDPAAEGGINFGEKSVNIYGNLIVDNLFELQSLPDGGQLKIVHDPALYFPEYPVRVSVGETRSMLAVDYYAE